MRVVDNSLIENISKTLGEIIKGHEISQLLRDFDFFDHDTHYQRRDISTKWKRLAHSISHECKKINSEKPLVQVIEGVMNPVRFTNEENVKVWQSVKKDINTSLSLYGFELGDDGRVRNVQASKTHSEAINRYKHLFEKLQALNVHKQVLEFCKLELLQDNYFHAIQEASKSTLHRIRALTYSTLDGTKLIEKAFSQGNPAIIIKGNHLSNLTEKSDYNALKHLLLTINYFYRNTTAHTPKIYNPKIEHDAVIALLMISQAHFLLDNCEGIKHLE